MSKLNSMGQSYVQQKDAWNSNKFMQDYALVNNEYYPFVHGNPNGWGSSTNPDPFFWGQPQAPKYCACGQSLKISQAEGFCDSCGGGAQYRARNHSNDEPDASINTALNSASGETPDQSQNNSDALLLGAQSAGYPVTAAASINKSAKIYKNPSQELSQELSQPVEKARSMAAVDRAQRSTVLRLAERSEKFVSSPDALARSTYGSARQYGTGSVGNGTISGAPVVPLSYYEAYEPDYKKSCNTPAMIGQHPPLNITAAGGIEYMNDSPGMEAAGWTPSQKNTYCAATNGGKKLAF